MHPKDFLKASRHSDGVTTVLPECVLMISDINCWMSALKAKVSAMAWRWHLTLRGFLSFFHGFLWLSWSQKQPRHFNQFPLPVAQTLLANSHHFSIGLYKCLNHRPLVSNYPFFCFWKVDHPILPESADHVPAMKQQKKIVSSEKQQHITQFSPSNIFQNFFKTSLDQIESYLKKCLHLLLMILEKIMT